MLSKIGKDAIIEFADTFCTEIEGFDRETFINETMALKQRVRGKDVQVPVCDAIMQRWYNSLEIGQPDFSVYEDVNVLQDVWACWSMYSRTYLREIMKRESNGIPIIESMGNVRCILDIGNGIGYSTAALTEIFPDAHVHGFNVKDSFQYKICEKVGKQYGFKMHHDIEKLGNVSLLLASEYFEHYYDPVEHLEKVIDITAPRNIIMANSFGTQSIGHFIEYSYGNKVVSAREINKIFNKKLVDLGYKKRQTTCWNNRPMFWQKIL